MQIVMKSKNRVNFITLALCAIGLMLGSVIQADEGKMERKRDQRSKRERVDRLTRAGLKIGDPLPDLTAYDSDGNPFKLSQLKGHYSVVVFGCLT